MTLGKRKKLTIALIAYIAGAIILIVVLLTVFGNKNDFDYESNKLDYSSIRASPKYSILKLSENENYTLYKIIYESKPFLAQEASIHGLLYFPKIEGFARSMVFLPGGGVRKEDEQVAQAIANRGYAVLIIDQRGIGETGGFYPSYEQDRTLFIGKQESIQHLGVYDALKAIDVLKHFEMINKEKIFIGGASMGGRYALIAAALDPSIKGALVISSAGFHVEDSNNLELTSDSYFLSIDPDRYIKSISPRKLVMIHSANDTIIKIEDAKITYSKADEPKKFITVDGSVHGYISAMSPSLDEALAFLAD